MTAIVHRHHMLSIILHASRWELEMNCFWMSFISDHRMHGSRYVLLATPVKFMVKCERIHCVICDCVSTYWRRWCGYQIRAQLLVNDIRHLLDIAVRPRGAGRPFFNLLGLEEMRRMRQHRKRGGKCFGNARTGVNGGIHVNRRVAVRVVVHYVDDVLGATFSGTR